MPLDFIQPQMTTGVLKTANALSELAGGSATGYQNTGYGSLPVGVIMPFPGATIPTGWVLCYGQAISRSVYIDLFAVIGIQYGSGNGTTTFNLPDLRGRVVAGRDNMGGTYAGNLTNGAVDWNPGSLGATGGAETLQLVEVGAGNVQAATVDENNVQPTMILNYIIKSNVNVVAA